MISASCGGGQRAEGKTDGGWGLEVNLYKYRIAKENFLRCRSVHGDRGRLSTGRYPLAPSRCDNA